MTVKTVAPQYISAREMACIMGVHYHTVLNLIDRGEVKAVKFGQQYRIPVEELNRDAQRSM